MGSVLTYDIQQINIYYVRNPFRDYIGKSWIVCEQVPDSKQTWKTI